MSRDTNSFFKDASAQHETPCGTFNRLGRELELDVLKCAMDPLRVSHTTGVPIAWYDRATVSAGCRAALDQYEAAGQKCTDSLSMKK